MMITIKRLFQAWSLNQSLPPWQWRRFSQPSRRLLLIQVLVLINLLHLPLAVTASGHDSVLSSSSESPQEQHVTISMSYSSTHFKAGPVNRRGNHSHNIINPNIRRHSLVSPVNRNSLKNSNIRLTNVNSNSSRGVKPRSRQALYRPINSPLSKSSGQGTQNETTTVKPTMHPLHVLQTEISLPTKPSSQRGKPRPKKLSNVGFVPQQDNQDNLSNHRMNSDEKLTLINNNNKNKVEPMISGVNLNNDVKAQLELINQRSTRSRITPNEVLSMNDKKEVDETDPEPITAIKEGRSDLSAIFSGESISERGAVEGRSASENIEQIKSKKTKGGSGGDESKQRSAGHFNYINTLEDQIAEEDHQYEVTEIVNQYPAEYENQDQGSETPQTAPTSSTPATHLSDEFQSQIQNPNHNYHNAKSNYKPEKTRPKLHSYYDQNYYLFGSSQPTNQALHYEYKNHEAKHQPHKEFHYNTNGNNDHGNFHSNRGPESHYVKPGFGPYWHHPIHQPQHFQRPEPSLGQDKYPTPHHQHQHYSPSPPKNNHPPPQLYKGEHDLQTQSTDTIMDRFEVFYKEYKILTWAALFVVTSLGFLAVLVYMYIRNPPTEVVTARSKVTEYLSDPGILKFLSKMLEVETNSDSNAAQRRRRRKEGKEF